jgi:hypothetical protein
VVDLPDLELEELIVRTNPELRKEAGERLALESRIRSGTLGPEERRPLLLEPFRMLDHRIRAAQGEPPGQVFTLALCAIPLSILGLLSSGIFANKVPEALGPACGGVLALSILILLRTAVRRLNGISKVSRVLRLEVYPLLGRALKPLNPSRSELEQVVATLRQENGAAGRVQVDRILAEIQFAP